MKAKEVFAEHSIKSTKARINIYNIMSDNNEGLKAEDIYNICRDKGVDINLSTVYRTLEIFEETNIVGKYDTGENSYKYFLNHETHKHILECSICHKEIELKCPMRHIEEMVKDETGFVLLDHELFMKGICKDCSNNKKHQK